MHHISLIVSFKLTLFIQKRKYTPDMLVHYILKPKTFSKIRTVLEISPQILLFYKPHRRPC